jgi:hypothetical protein
MNFNDLSPPLKVVLSGTIVTLIYLSLCLVCGIGLATFIAFVFSMASLISWVILDHYGLLKGKK